MAKIIRNSRFLLPSRFLNSPQPTGFNYTNTRRSYETIAYEEIQNTPDRPYNATAFVLHGLLGSGRNWRSFSRTLGSTLSQASPSSEWRMVLVDMRNHGRSTEVKGLDPPHDMANAARDVANLVKSQGWAWPDVVIGHSMGGKVGLQFTESCACGDYGDSAVFPKQLWVLDSAPGEVNLEASDGEVEKVLGTLQNLPSSVPSRKRCMGKMKPKGRLESGQLKILPRASPCLIPPLMTPVSLYMQLMFGSLQRFRQWIAGLLGACSQTSKDYQELLRI